MDPRLRGDDVVVRYSRVLPLAPEDVDLGRDALPPCPDPAYISHMITRLFLAHPRSVGESYAEHAATAAKFGATMMVGGAACIVHAVLPFLFVRTASDSVKRLYAQMKARQPAFAEQQPAFRQPEWQLDYEI